MTLHSIAQRALAAAARPSRTPVTKPSAQPVDNSAALEDAARMIEDLQLQIGTLEEKLQGEIARTVELQKELATMTSDRRQAESNYLQAAVDRGEAVATRTALESALANANATNARLAAMRPPSAPTAKPQAPPPWKMEVHRDGAGQIREIIATPVK